MLESFEARKKRAQKISLALKKLFPKAKIVLIYGDPWQLMVAVQLSAQCTDKKVNQVTLALFKKYKKLDDYVKADKAEFEQYIKPTGFYRAKTKNILAAAKMVKEKFRGRLPKTMKEMLTLSGVARKTANVVLGNAYGVVEGIAVDTHVARLAKKFNLTDHKDPVKIEKDLMALFPKKEWFPVTYRLINYGRHVCVRRKHSNCKDHPLTKIYPPAASNWP
ncbi:endonuclease III [Candidatus Wolfebacteria bacterium]|nr:endonuclease III [Candidatus Wolfebacteria bacterium]